VNENQEVQVRRRRSREEIDQLVVEYEASGSRVSDFCRTHDLKPSVLQRHLKMRHLEKAEPSEVKRLVPVALVETKPHGNLPSECALEVVLSSGRRIEVRPQFDSDTLKRLLHVLEGA
jgi:transposase-like protein